MSNAYAAFCQDMYVNSRLSTQMALPHGRETVLHFFERIQREYPSMSSFRRGDGGDLSLEEDRRSGSYRWVRLEARRLVCGHVNPAELDAALAFHRFVLEQGTFHLGISPLEIDHLEVLFGFDLSYRGNHDDVIVDSLYGDSPLACLLNEPDARAIDVQPAIAVALSDDCRLQARVEIISRTDSDQVSTGEYADSEISVYLTVRRCWSDRPKESLAEMAGHLFARADDLCATRVVPGIVRPISSAIASRS